jgi:CBS domain-containing protein
MQTVKELLKSRPTFSVNADITVLEAARFMVEKNIGAVPVLRDGELVGIFSERDIMKRVVAGARSPGMTQVAEVMTPRPHTVTPDTTTEACMFMMRENGFRHLPVCDGKVLLGLLSLRDLMMQEVQEKEAEARILRDYMQSSAGPNA